jgi:hypothetical protein
LKPVGPRQLFVPSPSQSKLRLENVTEMSPVGPLAENTA